MDDTTREVKSYADGLSGHIRLGCAPTMVMFCNPFDRVGVFSREV